VSERGDGDLPGGAGEWARGLSLSVDGELDALVRNNSRAVVVEDGLQNGAGVAGGGRVDVDYRNQYQ
jgi:hypothetical protein